MLRLLPVVVLVVAATAVSTATAVDDKYLETIKVSENIYVFKPKIDWTHGNGVAIIGSDGVFFIDTYIQFNYAEEAIRRLKKVTPLPVRYVLNTHWHTDHVMGNSVFKRVFPHCEIIVQDSTAVMLDSVIKPQVERALPRLEAELAQTDSEVRLGKRSNGTPIVGTMKPFWENALRDAREYRQHFRQERYVSADITFGDSVTMRWGNQTLKLIHMAQNGHAEGDVIVWIPEKRLLVAGDLVVGPTPYATHPGIPGMISAIRALIAMNPAVIIPGHGSVEYDLTYMQLLLRAFTAYRAAAESALIAKVPYQRAADSIAFPEIDRLFIGNDEMKRFSYRAFFSRNLIRQTYQHPPDSISR